MSDTVITPAAAPVAKKLTATPPAAAPKVAKVATTPK
jgi:hypothetical protein